MRTAIAILLSLAFLIPPQAEESVAGLRAEAEHGNIEAAYQLALALRDGKETPRDYIEAYAWFGVAAAVLDDDRAIERDELAKNMTAEQVAKAQQLSRDYFNKYVEPLLYEAE